MLALRHKRKIRAGIYDGHKENSFGKQITFKRALKWVTAVALMYVLRLEWRVQFVHLSLSSVVQVFTGAKLMKKANYAGLEIKFYTALPRIVEVARIT